MGFKSNLWKPMLLLLCVSLTLFHGTDAKTFVVINKCNHTIWTAIRPNAGAASLSTTGFALRSGVSSIVSSIPTSWSGHVWGRTHCAVNPTTGSFSCLTGDCRSSTVDCVGGTNISPPATLAVFTFRSASGLDLYGISLIKGYNLPLRVVPKAGSKGNCPPVTKHIRDLNARCPTKLRVMFKNQIIGCKSTTAESGDLSPPASCPSPANYYIIFCAKSPSLTSMNSQNHSTHVDVEVAKRSKHFPEAITGMEISLVMMVLILPIIGQLIVLWFCIRRSRNLNVGNFTFNCFPVNFFSGWFGARLAG